MQKKNIKLKEKELDNFIVVQNWIESRSTSKSIQKKTNILWNQLGMFLKLPSFIFVYSIFYIHQILFKFLLV